MQKKNKLKLFSINVDGTAKQVSEKDFSLSTIKDSTITWVQLELAYAKEFLIQHKISPEFVTQMLCAHETRPRTNVYQDGLIANFRAVNLNKGSSPEDMTSVRLWMTSNLIITVQRRELCAITNIEESFETSNGPKDIGSFLEHLLYHITEHSEVVVDALDEKVDELESNMEKVSTIELSKQLSGLRKKIILLRRHMLPQREAVFRIQTNDLSWFTDINVFQFREVSDALIRLLEDIDAIKDRTIVAQEILFAYSQESMNKRMYILSLVAIIFMPLGFLTGLLGINVSGMPGSKNPYGFLIVCILMFGIIACQVLLMRKRKWF